MALLTQIIRLLLAMVPNQRGQEIREEAPAYVTKDDSLTQEGGYEALLETVPMS
jgi:hypothetical protein